MLKLLVRKMQIKMILTDCFSPMMGKSPTVKITCVSASHGAVGQRALLPRWSESPLRAGDLPRHSTSSGVYWTPLHGAE